VGNLNGPHGGAAYDDHEIAKMYRRASTSVFEKNSSISFDHLDKRNKASIRTRSLASAGLGLTGLRIFKGDLLLVDSDELRSVFLFGRFSRSLCLHCLCTQASPEVY